MRKVIIQKVTCSFISLRITNIEFALKTPQQVKKVHHYLPYQKEQISLQKGSVKCWQDTFRSYWHSFLGTGKAPDHTIYSVYSRNNRGTSQVLSVKRKKGRENLIALRTLRHWGVWYSMSLGRQSQFCNRKGMLLLVDSVWKSIRLHVCLFSWQDFSFPRAASTLLSLVQ